MKCPTCTTVDLVMSERQGIEIDYCPTCRGVWLDRGELDKIIERSMTAQVVQMQTPAAPPLQPAPDYGHHGKDHHHDEHHGYGKHGKRSFLHDLFD